MIKLQTLKMVDVTPEEMSATALSMRADSPYYNGEDAIMLARALQSEKQLRLEATRDYQAAYSVRACARASVSPTHSLSVCLPAG